MTNQEAMRLALDALENHTAIKHPQQMHYRDTAIEALRQALEQPEQELVAWWCGGSVSTRKGYFEEMGWGPIKPLYASPPSKPWVSLTDEEINEVLGGDIHDEPSGELNFIRAIEAKLKEKNS